MKLSSVLCEGYGRTYEFGYDNFNIDPRPSVLALGRWVNHKGTKLLCGINLNYLSDDQVSDLQKNLQVILGDRNLKRRVRKLRSIVPQIFDRAYRTYNQDHVRIIAPGTLKFFREPKPQDLAEPTTKAVTPKHFVKPNIKPDVDKKEIEKPEDASKEIDNIDVDKRGVNLDQDEPKPNAKKILDKEKKDVDNKKIDKRIEQEKQGKEQELEKDSNFGKSKPEVIEPEDLDFEDGEEEQDAGLPSK
jgi:hypothetical protein